MAQRLVRAKHKIKAARIPYRRRPVRCDTAEINGTCGRRDFRGAVYAGRILACLRYDFTRVDSRLRFSCPTRRPLQTNTRAAQRPHLVTISELLRMRVSSDGEFGKFSWFAYIMERLDGYEVRPVQKPEIGFLGRDEKRYPDFFHGTSGMAGLRV
jgi:hypothetical protein